MIRRGVGRGGPGLIGTAARTAVIAGTATAVSGNVARRQQERAVRSVEAQDLAPPPPVAPPAPAAAPAMTEDVIAQLRELAALRDQGILTDEEFAAQKARLLA
jgi:hypothetical protein